MITFETDEENRILTVHLHGMVAEEDYDNALDDLEDGYPQVGLRLSGGDGHGIKVLLDWRKLDGWQKGARPVAVMAGKMMRDVVRRVAIVGDERWRGETEMVADVQKQAKVRFFTPDQFDRARRWLCED